METGRPRARDQRAGTAGLSWPGGVVPTGAPYGRLRTSSGAWVAEDVFRAEVTVQWLSREVVVSFQVRVCRTRPYGLVCVVLAVWMTALALVLGPAGPAAAHNALRSTDPADGATVPQPPEQLVLTFDGDVLDVGTAVQVTGPSGPVGLGPLQVAGPVVTQALPSDLPAGQYRVVWRVTSADGHPVDGTLSFTAAAGSAATSVPSSAVGAAPSGSSASSQAPASSAEATPTQPAPSADGETQGGLSPLVWVIGALAVVVVVAAAWVGATRRRRR